jgi:hypothetical protein
LVNDSRWLKSGLCGFNWLGLRELFVGIPSICSLLIPERFLI